MTPTLKNRIPTALFPVSEYGEFFSLLEVARLVQEEIGLHPVFLFKSDYGAIDTHSRILEQQNYSWFQSGSGELQFDARAIKAGVDDYLPTSVTMAVDGAILVPPADAGESYAPSPEAVPSSVMGVALFQQLRTLLERRIRGRADRSEQRDARLRFNVMGHYRRVILRLSRIFDSINPAIVISGQDYPLSVTTLAAHVAAKRGVGTVIVPFSMIPTTKEIAESFFGSRTNELKSYFAQRMLVKQLGNWVHLYRGRLYTRLSPAEALVSNALGLTPRHPWTPNAGLGVVFVPNQQGYDYCLSAGIPARQLHLTGALWSDRLVELAPTRDTRRDGLIRDILVFETFARNVSRGRTVPRRPAPMRVEAADRDQAILIFSWPPNQSPRKPNGLSSFDELNRALTDMLVAIAMSTSVKIAISLHPTLVHTPLGTELKAAGLYVLDKSLIEVIDCADVFCATVSSTLMWAEQLEIPALNFDIYSYGYREFTEAGMSEVETIASLRTELLRLVEDVAYRRQISDRMAAKRNHWVFSDGKARSRIVDGIRERLVHQNRSGDSA